MSKGWKLGGATALLLGLLAAAQVRGEVAQISGEMAPAAPSDRAAAAGAPEAAERVAVPQPSALAVRYHSSGSLLWLVDTLWGLAVPALLLWTGLSARLRSWARGLGRKWLFTLALYVVAWSLIDYLLAFPLAFYGGFVRQHDYGLSDQLFSKWLGDSLKELALGIAGGCLCLWLPYLLLRRSPRRWWLYTGLASLPFFFITLLVTPVWIDPLFNHFGPLPDQRLERQILDLAGRAGIADGRVFEVDKSADTKTVNAYVSGLFGTKRIVLWDTIVAKLAAPELLFVMGHEMGHYVLGHVAQGVLLGSAGCLVLLFLVDRAARLLLRRFGGRFGFSELADFASLPLLAFLLSALLVVFAPAGLAWSRHLEHEADRFGLELTRSNLACANAFVRLQQENLGYPRPSLLYKLWHLSHPSLAERIDFCNDYRPWERGEPLKYEHLFHAPGRVTIAG